MRFVWLLILGSTVLFSADQPKAHEAKDKKETKDHKKCEAVDEVKGVCKKTCPAKNEKDASYDPAWHMVRAQDFCQRGVDGHKTPELCQKIYGDQKTCAAKSTACVEEVLDGHCEQFCDDFYQPLVNMPCAEVQKMAPKKKAIKKDFSTKKAKEDKKSEEPKKTDSAAPKPHEEPKKSEEAKKPETHGGFVPKAS